MENEISRDGAGPGRPDETPLDDCYRCDPNKLIARDGTPAEASGDSLRSSSEPGPCGCGRPLGEGSRVMIRAEVSRGGAYHETETRTCYACAHEIKEMLVRVGSARVLLLKAARSDAPEASSPEGSPSPSSSPPLVLVEAARAVLRRLANQGRNVIQPTSLELEAIRVVDELDALPVPSQSSTGPAQPAPGAPAAPGCGLCGKEMLAGLNTYYCTNRSCENGVRAILAGLTDAEPPAKPQGASTYAYGPIPEPEAASSPPRSALGAEGPLSPIHAFEAACARFYGPGNHEPGEQEALEKARTRLENLLPAEAPASDPRDRVGDRKDLVQERDELRAECAALEAEIARLKGDRHGT